MVPLVPAAMMYTNWSDLVQKLSDPSDDNTGEDGEDSWRKNSFKTKACP